MITEETTKVYVRVNLTTKKIIGLSDQPLKSLKNKPVFEVASNLAKIIYYIVVIDSTAEYGITVRPATADEIVIIDARETARMEAIAAENKLRNINTIIKIYTDTFYKRFITKAFMSLSELETAAAYSGTDENMLTNIKPLAVSIKNAYNEWRFNNCQIIIDKYNDGEHIDILEARRNLEIKTELDAFLTEKGFDITTYC